MDEKGADIAHIHGIANAFKRSQILFTAHAAGLFDFLASAQSEADIAAAAGWPLRGARFMLRALAAMGLVAPHAGKWRNTPAAACLQSGAPGDQGAFLRHTRRGWETWGALDAALSGGTAARRGRHPENSEAQRDYARAMHAIALSNAPQCATLVDCSGMRRMLDLGSGMGAYTATFLNAWPALRAVLMDSPAVLAMAKEYMTANGMMDRCALIAGDARHAALPSGLDLVWISNVFHAWQPEECQACLARCFAALAPGGLLCIRDFLDAEAAESAAFHAVFSLDIMLHTESGGGYTADDIAAWAQEAGFAQERVLRAGRKSRIYAARKP